jgi:ATPase family associated with various cellular activities (AAA)
MARLLEQDIEALEALDNQRERCRDLLESGARSLLAWATADANKRGVDWKSAGDDVERPLVLRALNFIERQELVKTGWDKVEPEKQKLRTALKDITLDMLHNDRLPVFRACLIIEALVEDEDKSTGPFCEGAFACLYRVIAEIYRVGEPEWKVGGVRASENAPQTAFVTREAVRAVLLVRESLVNTALLLKELADAKKSWDSSIYAPPSWRTQNRDLRLKSFQTSLITRWPHLLKRELKVNVTSPTDDWTDQACEAITERLTCQRNKLRDSIDAMPSAGETASPSAEETASPSAENTVFFSSDASTLLNSLNKIFDKLLGKADQLLEEPAPEDQLPPEDKPAPKDEPLIVFRLNVAAAELLRGLHPTKVYLETALTAELAGGPDRTAVPPDAAQASFAAAGLGEIARASASYDRDDLRSQATAQLALSQLSERGALPARTPFDVMDFGYRLPPQGAEAIRAVCDMLRFSAADCDPETARKLVRYFLETRADRPIKDAGWHSDAEPSKEKGEVWVTALAFFALLDLRRMLDTEINRRVLRYFTKREPRELNVGLGQLFLPDTALAKKYSGNAIGAQLHSMYAHVQGASSGGGFSVVLYGPPGTGKTTLAEAVAKSSGSVLVEITPSDILIGGREQIERQTRVVFSALAMLTQSVILFDEFDSILHRRDDAQGQQITSEFQFLTPGLLPKLKRLHDRAEKQRVAYALATNYVGQIDDAAIRSGRFDRSLGIFPPDLLSRVGRLATGLRLCESEPGLNQEQAKRAKEVIDTTAGYGMATLGKRFTAPGLGKSLKGTLFGYIYRKQQDSMPALGNREADKKKFKQPGLNDPDIATLEWEQWEFVAKLDIDGEALTPADWNAYIDQVEELLAKAVAAKGGP